MRYVSTRGRAPERAFTDILLSGLADDGGLYVPTHYPSVSRAQLDAWRALSYAELATEIIAMYATDIPKPRLAELCRATYTSTTYGNARADSRAAEITPLRWLEPGLGLLELSNGPTLAFKDMAMQWLGAMFEHLLRERGGTLNILGATSGDTGSAAEYAMRGRSGLTVFMLSPQGRMSEFQRAQMYSLQDANIHNLAVAGTFDDCQDLVKAIAGDLDFKARWHIGSVNSINWGRVVAQIVYYFRGYLAATRDSTERVSFAVPSGNFGNILSGWIARQMGLPVDKLVLATNENDVLDEFFRTGRYRVRSGGETHATSSPSMDISKASNFERYMLDIVGRDSEAVRELWWQIDTRGQFHLGGSPFFDKVRNGDVVSGRSTHVDRLRTIRTVEQRYGVVIDPHTADGLKVALEHRDSAVPMICLETAQAVKFEATIVEAIGRAPDRPPDYVGIEQRPQRCVQVGVEAQAIREFIAENAH
jgi:threonine synthase